MQCCVLELGERLKYFTSIAVILIDVCFCEFGGEMVGVRDWQEGGLMRIGEGKELDSPLGRFETYCNFDLFNL